MELKKAQYLFEQFFPHGKVEHLQAITEGLINQTFVVFTTHQKFILQSINTTVFPLFKEGLFNILLVKKHLFEAKFPYAFPTPIQDKYIECKSEIWRLFPYIEDSVCYNKVMVLYYSKHYLQYRGINAIFLIYTLYIYLE